MSKIPLSMFPQDDKADVAKLCKEIVELHKEHQDTLSFMNDFEKEFPQFAESNKRIRELIAQMQESTPMFQAVVDEYAYDQAKKDIT